MPELRFSYERIARLVEPGSMVLDLGCGTGELMLLLQRERGCRCRGVDIGEDMVRACVARGLSVFQANLDEGLRQFATGSYDYVILNRTLQQVHRPVELLEEMLRVGRRGIVNFPNFGYLANRLQLLFRGRMPVHRDLPYAWHDTPNIHLCTKKDFAWLATRLGIRVLDRIYLRHGRPAPALLSNLLATEVCFVLAGRTCDTTV